MTHSNDVIYNIIYFLFFYFMISGSLERNISEIKTVVHCLKQRLIKPVSVTVCPMQVIHLTPLGAPRRIAFLTFHVIL